MRTIKFRFWCTFEKKMYDTAYVEEHLNFAMMRELLEAAQQRYIFQQFTGLTYSNGVEVYEGDIVTSNKGNCVICYDSRQARYKVVPRVLYNANAGTGGWTGFDLKYAETVIGNIYENPELLGASE